MQLAPIAIQTAVSDKCQMTRVLTATVIPRWEKITLTSILLLSGCLDFIHLDHAGYGNTYYATAVKSMLLSWHNFFFVAFDPGGYISVDKPPLGLWLQAISARVFGFSGMSLMLPSAIAGMLAVFLLYHIVRRAFPAPAALLAAGFLAISPINVVTNRINVLDSMLVLTMLGAMWMMQLAIERGALRYLLLTALFVGLGFNTKMLAAFLVIPTLFVVYSVSYPLRGRRKWLHLSLAGVVLVCVAFAWVVMVDLTPAANRPYVGSSQHNSEIELAFSYNGAFRWFGATSSAQPAQQRAEQNTPTPANTATPTPRTTETLPFRHTENGEPGPLRLFQPDLGSQAAWLLPFALIGMLSSLWDIRLRFRNDKKSARVPNSSQQQFILWVVCLVVMGTFFSFAHYISAYYLVILTPAISALAAIGGYGMWRDFQTGTWRRYLLPLAILMNSLEVNFILSTFSTLFTWLGLLVLGLGLGLAVWATTSLVHKHRQGTSFRHIALTIGGLTLCALTLAPSFWTLDSFRSSNAGGYPLSGPLRSGDTILGPPSADPQLIQFLRQHNDAKFLVATMNTGAAEGIIFATNQPVMALGGFCGCDAALTTTMLREQVTHERVRFFLLPIENLSREQFHQFYPSASDFQPHYSNALTQWLAQSCLPVPPSEWSGSADQAGTLQLFDCDHAEV